MNSVSPNSRSIKRFDASHAELAGQPLSLSKEPSVCPECGGGGYLRTDFPVNHPDFGKIDRCPTCSLDQRIAWLARHCGLDPAEQNRRYDGWQAGDWANETPETRHRYREQRKQAAQALQTALKERAGFYTFFGDFGAGKTLALQIVVNEARLQMVESFYAPFSLLLDHLRACFDGGQPIGHFWQRLLDIPVLCLDEVTRFNETPWAREKLFILADTRYRRRTSHLTLFATNDDPRQEIPSSEDIRYLYSRFHEGRLIELRGDIREAVKQP